jgi:hypothetical protein
MRHHTKKLQKTSYLPLDSMAAWSSTAVTAGGYHAFTDIEPERQLE